jgi:hypothetical protein
MIILNCAEWLVSFFLFSLSCCLILAALIVFDWFAKKWIERIWGTK